MTSLTHTDPDEVSCINESRKSYSFLERGKCKQSFPVLQSSTGFFCNFYRILDMLARGYSTVHVGGKSERIWNDMLLKCPKMSNFHFFSFIAINVWFRDKRLKNKKIKSNFMIGLFCEFCIFLDLIANIAWIHQDLFKMVFYSSRLILNRYDLSVTMCHIILSTFYLVSMPTVYKC